MMNMSMVSMMMIFMMLMMMTMTMVVMMMMSHDDDIDDDASIYPSIQLSHLSIHPSHPFSLSHTHTLTNALHRNRQPRGLSAMTARTHLHQTRAIQHSRFSLSG
jgi:hypothetical protein